MLESDAGAHPFVVTSQRDAPAHVVEPATPARTARVPSRRLDFLRGAAALYVVIGHARGHLFAGGAHLSQVRELGVLDYVALALLQLTSLGTEAVILFFVMSGFAMAHSFRQSESTLSFYKKRLIRIWPPYAAAVAVAFLFAAIILRSPEPNTIATEVARTGWGPLDAILMLLYVKVSSWLTAPFWSLPHEVMFYALCPLLLAGRSRTMLILGLSVAMAIGGMLILGIYEDPTRFGAVFYQYFFGLLVFFMIGAAAYHHQDRIPRLGGRQLLLVFAVSFVVIWFLKNQVLGGWNTITSLMTAPIAVLLIGNVPSSLYDRKWLNWGHFSYSLYIVHMQIIAFASFLIERMFGVSQRDMTSYWMWMLAIPPTVALSYLFYLAIEKRCDAALSRIRLRERVQADAAGITAPGVR